MSLLFLPNKRHAADLPPTASTFAAKGTTCPNVPSSALSQMPQQGFHRSSAQRFKIGLVLQAEVANIGGGLERKSCTQLVLARSFHLLMRSLAYVEASH